jgi:AcrR family transcriptional regulator
MTVTNDQMGSKMSANIQAPRRRLSSRQASRLERLTEAAVAELREHGYEGLTVRAVAARCGVAPATAYTYFASKNHLVAEVFWRRLCALPESSSDSDSAEDATVKVLTSTVAIVEDDPAVSAACTVAILAQEPEVQTLRDMIGAELMRRLEAALGDVSTPDLLAALITHWSGAFLVAGMGYSPFAQARLELDRSVRALMRSSGSD